MSKPAIRTIDQNRLLFDMLTAWVEQDPRYTLDGKRLDIYDMKEVLVAAYEKDTGRLAYSLDGLGVVYLSRSTRTRTKEWFIQFLTFVEAEGGMRGIIFKHTPPNPLGSPMVRFRLDGLPQPPRNERELRTALKASVKATEAEEHRRQLHEIAMQPMRVKVTK